MKQKSTSEIEKSKPCNCCRIHFPYFFAGVGRDKTYVYIYIYIHILESSGRPSGDLDSLWVTSFFFNIIRYIDING